MLINDIVNEYIKKGYNYRNAQNLAAEQIILTKIASSPLVNHITLKGGIVMFNITKSDRRVTQDIDFDLIRYSISDESIERFVEKLNSPNDDISVSIVGSIETLHQEDYQGARVHLLLQDSDNNKLRTKLDIGVHTHFAIEQDKIMFSFDGGNKEVRIKVNPYEQMFSEKLLSLARLGPLSTRYKDLYDLYYLINNNLLDIVKVRDILNLFFLSSKRKPNSMLDLINSVNDTLDDEHFAIEASKPASKWVDASYEVVTETIKRFISKL